MKKILISLFLLITVIIGCGIVYAAWTPIPGVDIPYDPPNYYSPTSISYPDSAPSVFTMRDLSRQGGRVFDYMRYVQEVMAVANKTEWSKTVLEMLGIEIIDSTPADPYILTTIKTDTNVINYNTMDSWRTSETFTFFDNKFFRDFNKYDNNGTEDYDPFKQHEELEKIYKTYANAIDEIRKTEEQEIELIMQIQEATNMARGEMEINQLKAQLEAVQTSLDRKRNALMGLYMDFKAAESKIEKDELIKQTQIIENAELIIEDPYDRSDLSKKQYKKSESIGFVTMK